MQAKVPRRLALGVQRSWGKPWGEHGMRPSNGVLHRPGETLFWARQTLGTICRGAAVAPIGRRHCPLASCGFSANDNDRSIFWDLSIRCGDRRPVTRCRAGRDPCDACARSEEHTSELQSQSNLVCRLLLEKKKKNRQNNQCLSGA